MSVTSQVWPDLGLTDLGLWGPFFAPFPFFAIKFQFSVVYICPSLALR